MDTLRPVEQAERLYTDEHLLKVASWVIVARIAAALGAMSRDKDGDVTPTIDSKNSSLLKTMLHLTDGAYQEFLDKLSGMNCEEQHVSIYEELGLLTGPSSRYGKTYEVSESLTNAIRFLEPPNDKISPALRSRLETLLSENGDTYLEHYKQRAQLLLDGPPNPNLGYFFALIMIELSHYLEDDLAAINEKS